MVVACRLGVILAYLCGSAQTVYRASSPESWYADKVDVEKRG